MPQVLHFADLGSLRKMILDMESAEGLVRDARVVVSLSKTSHFVVTFCPHLNRPTYRLAAAETIFAFRFSAV